MKVHLDEQIKRSLLTPYWTKEPLTWRDPATNIGIANLALDGQVGMFNLFWLLLNFKTPPPLQAYQHKDLAWLMVNAPAMQLEGRTLEERAAFWPLWRFTEALDRCVRHPPFGFPLPMQIIALHRNALERLSDLRT